MKYIFVFCAVFFCCYKNKSPGTFSQIAKKQNRKHEVKSINPTKDSNSKPQLPQKPLKRRTKKIGKKSVANLHNQPPQTSQPTQTQPPHFESRIQGNTNAVDFKQFYENFPKNMKFASLEV